MPKRMTDVEIALKFLSLRIAREQARRRWSERRRLAGRDEDSHRNGDQREEQTAEAGNQHHVRPPTTCRRSSAFQRPLITVKARGEPQLQSVQPLPEPLPFRPD